uniref:Eukaryotic translation initiation factor 2 subunit 2 n=1 Tax=Toxocara canis TaxID=6265 RepID=A0A183UYN2_TOXCA
LFFSNQIEKPSLVTEGIGVSNLIDANGPWPSYTYLVLLEMAFGALRERNPDLASGEKKKFIMRPPQVARAGSKKTAFANFAEICRAQMDANSCLIVKGRFQQKHFESVLRKYIKEYVTCHTCRSSETVVTKDTQLFLLDCQACGSRCSVAAMKSGFTAMVGKRAALRYAAEAAACR